MDDHILTIKNLSVGFSNKNKTLIVVDNINLTLKKSEILGIVGESGSGKTQAMLAVMRLIRDPGRIVSGEIVFKGEDLIKKTKDEMLSIRGNRIAMIFQDPMTSLDPVYTCGQQMTEALLSHENISRAQAIERSLDLLDSVGIRDPKKCINSYPFELSGGMCQRVMIAMSLLCSPELLIADEPTTALDVTVQSQILELLKKIREERHMSIILITHDFGVVSKITDRVAVMYAGKIMESAKTRELLRNPVHPYTKGLLQSMVKLNQLDERLYMINGTIPDAYNLPPGCRFLPRCPICAGECEQGVSEVFISDSHLVRCRMASHNSKEVLTDG